MLTIKRFLRRLFRRKSRCICGKAVAKGTFCSDECERDAIWQQAW